VIRFSLFFSILLALAACGGDIEPGSRSGDHPIIGGLKIAEIGASSLPFSTAYTGTVESRNRGILAARTDGRVTRIAVREGEQVQAGDLLLTIADNQAADRLREAEAALSGAMNRLAAAEARARLAQSTYERYQRLFANEAVTPQEMDRVTAEGEEARQQVAAAKAAVAGAESGRNAARTALAYSRVTAPYAGRVVRTQVEEGSTVQPGSPLLVLDRSGGLQVSAALPEARAGQVAVGDQVHVEVPALGQSFPGAVAEVQSAADPRSRTFAIKVDLPATAQVPPGLFARVVFAGSEEPMLLLPASAIIERGQLTGVYLVQDGILHYRLVKTGRQIAEQFEILSGLRPGDRVVVEGTERARSGARVEG